MTDWTKYLYQRHDYSTNNCFHLIKQIYKDELNIDIKFNKTELYTPQWIKQITFAELDAYAKLENGYIVSKDELTEFDVVVTKRKDNKPDHFLLYIDSLQFIHAPFNKNVQITTLDSELYTSIHRVYRYANKL